MPVGLEAGRYHLHVLRTVREVRNALCYVLDNARGTSQSSDARCRARRGSSPPPRAPGSWAGRPGVRLPEAIGPPPVARATTWLARAGWQRLGLLDPAEI
ncbi:MAG TPA: hypothetical protein VLC53_12765 [Myxococcota bacterium]|nr:hypothetical protein [Myxococcota bacterium]